MAKVDADSTPGGRALAARFNVTGFPGLIWFVNGRPQPYTQNPGNPQDSSDLVFWVVTQTDTITRTLTDQVCSIPDLSKSAHSKHKTQRTTHNARIACCCLPHDAAVFDLRISTKLSTATSTLWSISLRRGAVSAKLLLRSLQLPLLNSKLWATRQ
jgi:hypothetical protein